MCIKAGEGDLLLSRLCLFDCLFEWTPSLLSLVLLPLQFSIDEPDDRLPVFKIDGAGDSEDPELGLDLRQL